MDIENILRKVYIQHNVAKKGFIMKWLESVMEAFKQKGGCGTPDEIIALTKKIREQNNDTWGTNGMYQVWATVEDHCKGYAKCGPNPLFEKIEKEGKIMWRLLQKKENEPLIDNNKLLKLLDDFMEGVFTLKRRKASGFSSIGEGLGGREGQMTDWLDYKMSFGQGNMALVPWLAFYGFDQKIQKGIYPVLLFDTQAQVNNLSICYGVSKNQTALRTWPAKIVEGKSFFPGLNYNTSYVAARFTINTPQDFELNKDQIAMEVSKVIKDFKDIFENNPINTVEESNSFDEDNTDVSYPLNQIIYGAPGTGKTYNTVIRALEIVTGQKKPLPADKAQRQERYTQYLKEFESMRDQIQFVTFHQSMAYEEFVQGIKPVIGNKDSNSSDQIQYEYTDGIFKKIADTAKDNPNKNYVLIIDEINRGNISKILGELITLLEPSKRLGASEPLTLKLQYSQEDFGVPNNLYIIGTMNTSDRSIAALDVAIRRRFKFYPMPPETELVTDVSGIRLNSIFEKMNRKIEILLDEDHMIGHSYLMKCKNVTDVKDTWFNNIMPLLNEYFYGDWDKLKLVLGTDFVLNIIQNDLPEEFRDYCSDANAYRFAKISDFSDQEFVNTINKLG